MSKNSDTRYGDEPVFYKAGTDVGIYVYTEGQRVIYYILTAFGMRHEIAVS